MQNFDLEKSNLVERVSMLKLISERNLLQYIRDVNPAIDAIVARFSRADLKTNKNIRPINNSIIAKKLDDLIQQKIVSIADNGNYQLSDEGEKKLKDLNGYINNNFVTNIDLLDHGNATDSANVNDVVELKDSKEIKDSNLNLQENNTVENLSFVQKVSQEEQLGILILKAIWWLTEKNEKINIRNIAERVNKKLSDKKNIEVLMKTARKYCSKGGSLFAKELVKTNKTEGKNDLTVELTDLGRQFLQNALGMITEQVDEVQGVRQSSPMKVPFANVGGLLKSGNSAEVHSEKRKIVDLSTNSSDGEKNFKKTKYMSKDIKRDEQYVKNLLIFLHCLFTCVEGDTDKTVCMADVLDAIEDYDGQNDRRSIRERIQRYIKNGDYVARIEGGKLNKQGTSFKLTKGGIDRINQAIENNEFKFIEKLIKKPKSQSIGQLLDFTATSPSYNDSISHSSAGDTEGRQETEIDQMEVVFLPDFEPHDEIEAVQAKESAKKVETNIKQNSIEVGFIVDSNTEEEWVKTITSEVGMPSSSTAVYASEQVQEANESSAEGFGYDSIQEKLTDSTDNLEQQSEHCNSSGRDGFSAEDILIKNLPKEIPFIDSSFEKPTWTFDFIVDADSDGTIALQAENVVMVEKNDNDSGSSDLKVKKFSISEWDIKILFAVSELGSSVHVRDIIDFINEYFELYEFDYLKRLIYRNIENSPFLSNCLHNNIVNKKMALTVSDEGVKFLQNFFPCLEKKLGLERSDEEIFDDETARKAFVLTRSFSIKDGSFKKLSDLDENILLAVMEKGGKDGGISIEDIMSFFKKFSKKSKNELGHLKKSVRRHTRDNSNLCDRKFLAVEKKGRKKYLKITGDGMAYLEKYKVKQFNLSIDRSNNNSNLIAKNYSDIHGLLNKENCENKNSAVSGKENSEKYQNCYTVTKGRWGRSVYSNFDSSDPKTGSDFESNSGLKG